MTTITHTAFGILLAKVSMDTGLVPTSPSIVYPLGMLSANLPDFDTLGIHFPKNHRESLMHTPLFWLLIISLLSICVFFAYPVLLPYIQILAVGVLSHFVFDTFDMSSGIAWLKPFNKTFFNILPRKPRPTTTRMAFVRSYLSHPVMIAEGVFTTLCVIAFLKM